MTHSLTNIIDLTNAPTPPRWFEFLLEPNRLRQHLETNGCDPSPTELITLFFRNIPFIALSQEPISSSSQLTAKINNVSPPATTTSAGTESTTTTTTTSPTTASTTNGHSIASDQEEKGSNSPSILNDNLLDKLVVDFAPAADQNSVSASNNEVVHIPPDSYEAKYRAKKAYALQTLAIKVASFIKWDLNTICNNLTIPIQYKLMQSLNLACSSTENCPPEVKKFSDIIYCHWFLKSAISYQLSNLQPQLNNTTIIYLSQLQQQQQAAETNALYGMGELFAPTSKQLRNCSNDLHSYIWELSHNKDNSPKKMKTTAANHPFRKAKLSIPLMDCFDSRDDQFNDWTKCESLESREYIEAACYDLGRFFFFEESYKLAKESFELIKESNGDKFPRLKEYLQSSTEMLSNNLKEDTQQNGSDNISKSNLNSINCDPGRNKRESTEKYLFDCMTKFSKSQASRQENMMDVDENDDSLAIGGEDLDLRIGRKQPINLQDLAIPRTISEQQIYELARGDFLMSQGNFKQAMSCFVGSLMLMTDYYRFFSKSYIEEEPYVTRMIQCSISLSCFTQAVALCQMTRNINYTIAFKQLNERVCNDCCDDIYECLWNITLLEYIINLHSKRGEVERRTRVIQLIGQLELNENNPEEILKEAEHVRRGKFFRILSNKYL